MNYGGTENTEYHGGRERLGEGSPGGGRLARETANQLAGQIIGSAIEVHRVLGPGLLESVYEECLGRELVLLGIQFRRQALIPITYKGAALDTCYRVDVLVEERVVVELKAVDRLEPIHEAQLLTYLRLSNRWLGLLINFNTVLLKDGVRRMVNQ